MRHVLQCHELTGLNTKAACWAKARRVENKQLRVLCSTTVENVAHLRDEAAYYISSFIRTACNHFKFCDRSQLRMSVLLSHH